MNYLFHLYLSGDDPDILTGNFMGDFVKGRLSDNYPPRLLRGLRLHRAIDSFAEDEPHFNESRRRLSDRFGLYRGVMVDLFYDHFLASTWSEWSPEPLGDYLHRTRLIVEARRRHMPERLQGLVPIIFDDLILSYRDTRGVSGALARISKRVKRENPLAKGGVELIRHYEALHKDFLGFLPAVRRYSVEYLTAER